ncbi:uncharacterized protein [Procambarus clarkii]|uniref:uncharacterized protein n=1 Tax=Procambarus clarkii TaxID=6728 RepID=UPI003743B74E
MPCLVPLRGLNTLISTIWILLLLTISPSINTFFGSVEASVTFNSTSYSTPVVAAPSHDAATCLAALFCIGETPVRVSKNAQLNASVGTVLLPHHVSTGVRDLKDCHEDIKHILEAQSHSILQVDTFTRPPRGRRCQPLRVVKITFDSRALPPSIILAGARCSVQEYIPSPRLCNKCWKFGYGVLKCTSTVYLCPLCGDNSHSKSECTSPQARCLNCGEAHPTFSRSCMHYKLEKAVLNLKHRVRLSFPEARRQVRRLTPFAGISYARVLRSTSPRPSRLPQSHNRFQALNPTTPTTSSLIPLPPVLDSLSPGSPSGDFSPFLSSPPYLLCLLPYLLPLFLPYLLPLFLPDPPPSLLTLHATCLSRLISIILPAIFVLFALVPLLLLRPLSLSPGTLLLERLSIRVRNVSLAPLQRVRRFRFLPHPLPLTLSLHPLPIQWSNPLCLIWRFLPPPIPSLLLPFLRCTP